MKPYGNRSGHSGVTAYEYGSDWIRIRFVSGEDYTYFRQEIGARNLATMKRLADAAEGLATFINKRAKVKHGYSERATA